MTETTDPAAPPLGAARMGKPAAWRPTLSSEGPRYRALADAIVEAVETGALRQGDRLPPVRELAWSLKVTPGTVSRAYHLAETKGVLEGQVGRGTFVADVAPPAARTDLTGAVAAIASCAERANASAFAAPRGRPAGLQEPLIDFVLNCAADVGQDVQLTESLSRLIARGPLPLSHYHRYGEDQAERAAAAAFLSAGGLPERPEDTILCSGAHHGLLTAMAATLGGADAVALTEPLAYPGLKDLARALGVRLEPVAADPVLGLEPEAVEAAAARLRPGAIILSANAQNPTLATMPTERREAIAEIALRRRIPIIEDDVYGWLGPRPAPSFPNLAPSVSWYVTSLSKCVAAGLRAGFLLCPPGDGARGARLLQGYTLHVSWIVSALTAELIESGAAASIVEAVERETAMRAEIARRLLGPQARAAGVRLETTDRVPMAWLELPEPWRGSDFAEAALARGVWVMPAEHFVVGRAPAPHAVRVSFGACDRAALEAGMRRLAALLGSEPEPADHRA